MKEWARRELERIPQDEEGMQGSINEGILEVVEVFVEQGHSGFSASYALSVLRRLLNWKPLTPLTGEDDEWCKPLDEDGTQQNKRCSSVFRKNHDNCTAYDIDGKIFSRDGGETWFSCRDSLVSVNFPYRVPEEPERIILEGEV